MAQSKASSCQMLCNAWTSPHSRAELECLWQIDTLPYTSEKQVTWSKQDQKAFASSASQLHHSSRFSISAVPGHSKWQIMKSMFHYIRLLTADSPMRYSIWWDMKKTEELKSMMCTYCHFTLLAALAVPSTPWSGMSSKTKKFNSYLINCAEQLLYTHNIRRKWRILLMVCTSNSTLWTLRYSSGLATSQESLSIFHLSSDWSAPQSWGRLWRAEQLEPNANIFFSWQQLDKM